MLRLASKTLLFPYYAILKMRHLFYDKGLFKSKSYPLPTLCIGNVAVGGTGKTPHSEMLIRQLGDKGVKVALLSRGYGRKTKGFRYVQTSDTFMECGDEPLQIKCKFPDVNVAVCEDRCAGIERLMAECSPQIILLDDAFQHRSVKPSGSIVLINFNNPPYSDNLLPIGRLRDLPERIWAADDIIVTNTPFRCDIEEDTDSGSAEEYAAGLEGDWRKRLQLRPGQRLWFSVVRYLEPEPVFPELCDLRYKYSATSFLFTAIADDSAIRNHMKLVCKLAGVHKFADHRNFSSADLEKINKSAKSDSTSSFVTTEKDSKRLASPKCAAMLSDDVKRRLFYLPIRVEVVSSGWDPQRLFM